MAEAVPVEVAADRGGGRLGVAARHQPDVDHGHGAARHDRLTARADVAAGDPGDVQGRPEQQRLQQLRRSPRQAVAGGMGLAQVLGRVEGLGQLGEQAGIALGGSLTAVQAGHPDALVRVGQGRQGVDERPHRRRDPGLLAGVQVDRWPTPVPGLRDQLEAAEPLAAEDQLRLAVEAGGEVQVERGLGPEVGGAGADHRRQVGAAELLLTLDHEHDGERRHRAELPQHLDGQEEGGQAALGVGGAPGDDGRPDPVEVANLGRERRRGPLGLLGGLHVVHAVAEQPRGAGRAG